MRNDATARLQPKGRPRPGIAALLQILAGAIAVVGFGFLWGLAITDAPDLLDHIRDTSGPPGWLAVKWAAMADAASVDPWRWFGIGASLIIASAGILLMLAERVHPRPPRAPF